jgi:hypothetical protein
MAVATPHTLIKGFKQTNGESCRRRFFTSILCGIVFHVHKSKVCASVSMDFICFVFHVCFYFGTIFNAVRLNFSTVSIADSILKWISIRVNIRVAVFSDDGRTTVLCTQHKYSICSINLNTIKYFPPKKFPSSWLLLAASFLAYWGSMKINV